MIQALTIKQAAERLGLTARFLGPELHRLGMCFYVGKSRRVTEEQLSEYREYREETYTPGHVYFFQGAETGLIKIGYSTDPERRLRDLTTMSPDQITVLATFRGAVSDERKLHKRFKKHRAHGEWFKPAKPILDYIDTLSEED